MAAQLAADGNFAALETSPDFQNFQQGLATRGLDPANAYLFVRGHNLFDRVALKILRWAAQPYINQRFAELDPAGRTAYQAYRQANDFEKLLRGNQGYFNSEFYQKILADARLCLE